MNRKAFSLIELLVVIAIIGVFLSMLVPAIQKAREAANRVQCENHLRQIGVGMHSFHDVHRRFPTNCNQAFTRTVPPAPLADDPNRTTVYMDLLPFVEEGSQVDTCRTDPRPVALFLCPSRRTTAVGPRADYASGISPHAFWGGTFGGFYWYRPSPSISWRDVFSTMDGIYQPRGVSIERISRNGSDGTAYTGLLTHKGVAPQDYAGTGARDGTWSTINGGTEGFWTFNRFPGFLGRDRNGSYFNLASTGVTADYLLTSPHPQASPMLYCDGSVRPLSYNIGIDVSFVWGHNDRRNIDLDTIRGGRDATLVVPGQEEDDRGDSEGGFESPTVPGIPGVPGPGGL